jgi:hypothetical protein
MDPRIANRIAEDYFNRMTAEELRYLRRLLRIALDAKEGVYRVNGAKVEGVSLTTGIERVKERIAKADQS